MPKKDSSDTKRSKGKDKQKKTFDKFGKNTSRGLRFMEINKSKGNIDRSLPKTNF